MSGEQPAPVVFRDTPEGGPVPCPDCHGTGKCSCVPDRDTLAFRCERCADTLRCPYCYGKGTVWAVKAATYLTRVANALQRVWSGADEDDAMAVLEQLADRVDPDELAAGVGSFRAPDGLRLHAVPHPEIVAAECLLHGRPVEFIDCESDERSFLGWYHSDEEPMGRCES